MVCAPTHTAPPSPLAPSSHDQTREVREHSGQEQWIGSFMNLSFECDDVFATAVELEAAGVELIQPAKAESWGTSAKFRDSEGNQFVLSSR